MDAEDKKLEDEIKECCLGKNKGDKARCVRSDDRSKAYCHELISLMPWLGPHIAKRIDQGSTLRMVKCAIPAIKIKGGYSPQNIMDDKMKLFTGGVTT